MKIGMYSDVGKDEPFAWGVILADVAKHVANAITARSEGEYEDILLVVSNSFEAEIRKSTAKADGSYRGH